MASVEEIQNFLRNFKFKVGFNGIIIETTKLKNFQTIAALELSRRRIIEVLNNIDVTDYNSGPVSDVDHGPDLWVFCCDVDDSEIYVKITLGKTNEEAVCISFHVADWKMKRPYKT